MDASCMNRYQPQLPDDTGRDARGLVPAGETALASRDPYHYPGTAAAPAGDAPLDFHLDILEYLRIVVKHRWLILSIVAACVVLGVVITLMKTPLYVSTVRLQIDRGVAKIVEGGNITPVEGADSEFLRTQYELLQGPTLARRVASALKLGEDPVFFHPREFSITGSAQNLFHSAGDAPVQASRKLDLESSAARVVMENRSIRPIMGSRLVDISYADPEPVRAQKIAAAYAEAFIASNIDKRFEANSYAKVFLENQIQQLKLRLEQSEKTLLDFAQKEQIVQTNDKVSIAESNLAAANGALGALISERIKNEQLWKQLEASSAINVPQLLTNSVIGGLRTKRSELVTAYQEKSETFKPGFPVMVQLGNQIAEIDRQLTTEVKTLKNSYKAAYAASLSQEEQMKARIENLKREVLDLQKRGIEYNILKREADTNRALYDSLLQRYKEVDIAGGANANNIFVVDKASLPGAPSSPRMSVALLVSLLIGLTSGIGAAFLLERLDDTLRSPEETERLLGYATLGIIPKVAVECDMKAELANPRSHLSEAYRSLCTALQLSSDKGLPKTLLVTSAGPREGKSTTSITLARHFGNIGLKVLLVDGDMRKPSLHIKLGLVNGAGLSNYLSGAAEPPDLLQKTDVPNLAFISAGPLPPNAADLLGSPRLLSLLSIGGEVFDLIVVDSPPVMGIADAPLLSSALAATIFVIGAGQVRKGLVRSAIKRLQFSRGSLIGTVMTKFDARNSYGYGYGYGYGDGYGYGADDAQVPKLAGAQAGK
jgi:capsular exopolysaccharide synthesis family protein